jgi:hypothetical protein
MACWRLTTWLEMRLAKVSILGDFSSVISSTTPRTSPSGHVDAHMLRIQIGEEVNLGIKEIFLPAAGDTDDAAQAR